VKNPVSFSAPNGSGTVVVHGGKILCMWNCASFIDADAEVVDLKDGSISPGIVAAGSGMGLAEIAMEPSTTDGVVYDALRANPPAIIGGEEALIHAIDGLQFGTRDAL
jgi:imidazolonepropionase-like amidohydrolase